MKRLSYLLFSCLLLAGLGLGWLYHLLHRPLTLPAAEVDFTLRPGQTLRDALRSLRDAGVEISPELLYWRARLSGRGHRLVAGSYTVRAGDTAERVLDMLERGELSLGELTLIEGWTFRQVRAAIERHPHLRPDTRELNDAEIARRLGIAEGHPEGWLFPDTYRFDKHSGALELLREAHRAMRRELDAAWARRSADTPLKSPYQALILASIVEKETGRDEDRPLIASVFINRLRMPMRLQTDPTVIYGLGEVFDGNLTRRHLQTDHPWNTYTRDGLPPTPIAMPGRAALQAVVEAPRSDKLYFVARGDGSSEFSATLDAHNRAVNRYQRGDKQP